MPKLEKIQPTLNRLTSEVPAQRIEESSSFDNAITALGKTGVQIGEALRRASLLHEKTKAQNVLDSSLRDIRARADQDNDTSLESIRKYHDEVDAAVADSGKFITIPAERSLFNDEASSKANIVSIGINNTFNRKNVELGKEELNTFLDSKQDEFIQAQSLEEKQKAVVERDDKIREAVDAGFLEPDEVEKIKRDITKQWGKNQVIYDISTNPELAQILLERKTYPDITEAERAALLNDSKKAVSSQKAEAEKIAKEQQANNMKDATLSHLKGEMTFDKAVKLFENGDIDQKQFEDLKKMVLDPDDVAADVNLETYNQIKEMIYNNVDRFVVQRKINESIGKTLTKEDSEELLDELFKETTANNKNIKSNALEKVRSFSKINILGEFTFESLTGEAEGKAKELEFLFNKQVIQENATGQRIYEIADEVIDGYLIQKDPNYRPEKKKKENIRVLPEGTRAINPATGEIKQIVGGEWVTVTQNKQPDKTTQ